MVLHSNSEEDLKVIVGYFVEVSRVLEVYAGKSKMMMLGEVKVLE